MAEALTPQRQITEKVIFEKIGRLYTSLDEAQIKLNIAINEMAKLGSENKKLKAEIEELKKNKQHGKKKKAVTDIKSPKESLPNGHESIRN